MSDDKVKKYKKSDPAYTVDNTSTDVTDVPTITRLLNRRRFGVGKNKSRQLRAELKSLSRQDIEVPEPSAGHVRRSSQDNNKIKDQKVNKQRQASLPENTQSEPLNQGIFFGPTQIKNYQKSQQTQTLSQASLPPLKAQTSPPPFSPSASPAPVTAKDLPVTQQIPTPLLQPVIPTQSALEIPREIITEENRLEKKTADNTTFSFDEQVPKISLTQSGLSLASESGPAATGTFATATETAPTPLATVKAQKILQPKIIVWTRNILMRSSDPLGQALLHLIEKGVHSSLFLAIGPPVKQSSAPQFRATAMAEGSRKSSAWTQMTWDPSLTPSLWNEFIKMGKLDLPPASENEKNSKTALIRQNFKMTSSEWLVLVRVGPIHACRGVLAVAADQSVLRSVDEVFHLICAPIVRKPAA